MLYRWLADWVLRRCRGGGFDEQVVMSGESFRNGKQIGGLIEG